MHASVDGWWHHHPWRLVQTNLREIDMAAIDAERYVASLLAMEATVAMINTSGIVASYPTAHPFHTPSTYVHGDDLATIIAACHDAGIRVIARTDFSKVRRALYEQHPAWASIRADGSIVEEEGDVHVCVNGDYQRVHAPAIVEETITTLDVDGIYFNWSGYLSRDYRGNDLGICRCDACRARFAEMANLELPEGRDIDDPVYRRYLAFQDRTLAEDRSTMHEHIRRLRPDLAIDRAFPSGGFVRQESNTAIGRRTWPYSASDDTRWVVSSYPRMVSSNASVAFIDFPVRHVHVAPELQRLRLVQALANGGGLDHYVIGLLDRQADRAGAEAVREVFAFHAANEVVYGDRTSCARVALLTGPRPDVEEHRGWFRVMAEHHVLADTIVTAVLSDEVLARYGVVVIPGLEAISDEGAGRLDAFVEAGGSLIASGLSATRDETYEPRTHPALACLGVERILAVRPDARGAYLLVDDRRGFGRLGATDLLYVDGPYLDAVYAPDVRRHLRLIPPGPFGPPEHCVVGEPGEEPGMTTRTVGDGVAIGIPWRCGALVDRDGHPGTVSFLADVLEHQAGAQALGGTLSPMVEVTLSARPGGLVLHLVNTSGHHGARDHAPVPMRDVEVVVPFEGEPAAVEALVGGTCSWSASPEGIVVRIPELDLFEAVTIDRAER
jgi:hypothetical protein